MTYFKSLLTAAAATTLAVALREDRCAERSRRARSRPPTRWRSSCPPEQNRDVGQLADYYVTTRGVTATFNGGSAWVLILIHAIVAAAGDLGQRQRLHVGPAAARRSTRPTTASTSPRTPTARTTTCSAASRRSRRPRFLPLITGHADPTPGDDLRATATSTSTSTTCTPSTRSTTANAQGDVKVDYDLAAKHLGLTLTSVDIERLAGLARLRVRRGRDRRRRHDVRRRREHRRHRGARRDDDALALARDRRGPRRRAHHRRRPRHRPGDRVASAGTRCSSRPSTRTTQNFQPTDGDPSSCAFADQDLPPAQ